MTESLIDLRARLELLKEFGVAQHDPTTGMVAFFTPKSVLMPMSKEAQMEVEARRAEQQEAIEQKRKFGASGGFVPNQLTADEIEIRHKSEKEEQLRFQRQSEKVRAARAQLDAKTAQ